MPTATYFLPVQDVYISSAYGDTNFYAPPQGEVLFAGSYTGADDIYRTLLQFDLWGANRLPPNITIISAFLQLYMYRNDNVNVATLNGYSILESFNQQIVTFNSAPPVWFPVSEFTNGEYTPPSAASPINIEMTRLVQNWYDGQMPNNGIELRGVENDANNILGFRSTRFPNSRFWPKLLVIWSKGTVSEEFSVIDTIPGFSDPIFMEGQEQVTFQISNNTNAPMQGVIQVSLYSGASFSTVPNTEFTIPVGESRAVSLTAAANYARVAILSGGTGAYTVKSMTRDE